MGNSLFAMDIEGYIKVPEKAVYNFNLITHYGGVLYIDDMKVVNNNAGRHFHQKTGKIALDKGYHKFKLKYFQTKKYKRDIKLSCKYNNNEMKEVSVSWFYN
ncbi:MAG: PA14 domain-containing protein [Bacteroidales bacterium]